MPNYGLPYMGNKSGIIHKIAQCLPDAANFYDLFGGGFAVTHFMLLHKRDKFKNFYFNEIESTTVELIKDAIAGKYNYKTFKPEWVSREDFFKKKETCAHTRVCWSFGNDQKSYLFGKEIEAYKRSLHDAVVFNRFDETAIKALGINSFLDSMPIKQRRLFVRKTVAKRDSTQRAGELEQLEQLERLERLERLEGIGGVHFSSKGYDELEIKPNSVVYCDPPYEGTAKYIRKFDHQKFWDWAINSPHPVYVSEYNAPVGMKVIAAFREKKSLSSRGMTVSVEKLFCNPAAAKDLKTFHVKRRKAQVKKRSKSDRLKANG